MDQWLHFITERIEFKTALLIYKSLYDPAPKNISGMLVTTSQSEMIWDRPVGVQYQDEIR